MAKFCENCGNQLDDSMNFCGKCGCAVVKEQPVIQPVVQSENYFDTPPMQDVILTQQEIDEFNKLTDFAENVKKKKNLSYKLTRLGSALSSALIFIPLLLGHFEFVAVDLSFMESTFAVVVLFFAATILPYIDFLIDILSKKKLNKYLHDNAIDYGKYLRFAEKYLVGKDDTLLFLSTSAVIKQDIEAKQANTIYLIITAINVLLIVPNELFVYLYIRSGFSNALYMGFGVLSVMMITLNSIMKKQQKKITARVSEWENVMKEKSILGK